MARNTTLSFEFYPPQTQEGVTHLMQTAKACLLYTSDAADDSLRVDLGGRRIIKKNECCSLFRSEPGE